MRFLLQNYLPFYLIYGDPPSTAQVDLSVDRKWGPLILCLSSQRRGGGEGWAEESFPVRFINVTFQLTDLLQFSLLICDVSPFSNQFFRRFFSVDNLRGYGEDDTSSSSCLGPSSKELPSPSAGTAPPLGTQAAVIAGTPSSVVPVK